MLMDTSRLPDSEETQRDVIDSKHRLLDSVTSEGFLVGASSGWPSLLPYYLPIVQALGLRKSGVDV